MKQKKIHSTTMKCFFLASYLLYFMILSNLLLFQVARNSVIEIQIIKQNDNHSQDSAINSL